MDEIEAEHVASDARIFPLERDLRWVVTRANIDGLWLLHVREFEARIRHVAMQPHRIQIYWELPWDDAHARPLTLRRCTRHHEDVWRTVGRTEWAAISLPLEEINTLSEVAGEDLSPPDVMQLVKPSVQRGDQFTALHREILTTAAGELEVQRALRMQMITRLIECMVTGDSRPPSLAFRARADIMRRFHRYIEDQGDRPLHVPELCQAIGVPERTLRYCCRQQLGMSPRAYLTLRRLTLVRRLLLREEVASVADAARQYGFWHMGRFAQAYRTQFGEMPSATIRASRSR